jgi:hypothetical protein
MLPSRHRTSFASLAQEGWRTTGAGADLADPDLRAGGSCEVAMAAETKPAPFGIDCVNETSVAGDGPEFVTVDV